ncbi:MAG TPA: MerR family transcriptional regulator [Methylibium sp.]|nr:MerR family transcriptional regulator [Methylibium sp.]
MSTTKPPRAPARPPLETTAVPQYRSGAVARMLRMPVATLRVWERRYGLTQPALSPSGQRLYTADDVRRLALLKQLTDLGHAIGSLAALDMAQLQRVASTHAHTLASAQARRQPETPGAPRAPAWRLAVVGEALGARLRRPGVLQRLGRPVTMLGPFADAAQAAAALQDRPVDAVLLHEPALQMGWLVALEASAPAVAALPKAVLFGFAADAVCASLAAAGIALLREPQPDVVLSQWLRGWSLALSRAEPAGAGAEPAGDATAPRRWDDAALADFAGLSTTVACECPRHVAELLIQLSHFEAYSAQCEHRSPEDAELHAYLRRVAAGSRARFEAALEQVALHEGLLLPAPSR